MLRATSCLRPALPTALPRRSKARARQLLELFKTTIGNAHFQQAEIRQLGKSLQILDPLVGDLRAASDGKCAEVGQLPERFQAGVVDLGILKKRSVSRAMDAICPMPALVMRLPDSRNRFRCGSARRSGMS